MRNICTCFIILLSISQFLYSQTASTSSTNNSSDISRQIKLFEQELDGFRKSKASDIAGNDIDAIEKNIIRAKEKLKKKEFEEANYIVEITQAMFAKIEARMELYYSKQVYESTKKRLNK